MRVVNADAANANLVLTNVRTINNGAQPSNTPYDNRVTGLLNTASNPMPTCRARVGDPSQPMSIRLGFATPVASSLRAECPTAATLKLSNTNGRCLQVIWANASTINVSGNRSAVVHIDPKRTSRTTINVNGLTSWGMPTYTPTKASPTNTRIIVRLSELQSDASKAKQITILGRLQYKVAPHRAVVIIGCGANTVDCRVTDRDGKNVCRAVRKCTTDAGVAKAHALEVVNAPNPCAMTAGML